jgi:hypothetical protein
MIAAHEPTEEEQPQNYELFLWELNQGYTNKTDTPTSGYTLISRYAPTAGYTATAISGCTPIVGYTLISGYTQISRMTTSSDAR